MFVHRPEKTNSSRSLDKNTHRDLLGDLDQLHDTLNRYLLEHGKGRILIKFRDSWPGGSCTVFSAGMEFPKKQPGGADSPESLRIVELFIRNYDHPEARTSAIHPDIPGKEDPVCSHCSILEGLWAASALVPAGAESCHPGLTALLLALCVPWPELPGSLQRSVHTFHHLY